MKALEDNVRQKWQEAALKVLAPNEAQRRDDSIRKPQFHYSEFSATFTGLINILDMILYCMEFMEKQKQNKQKTM